MSMFHSNRGVQTIGLVIGIIVVLAVAGGTYFFLNNNDTDNSNTVNFNGDAMIKDDPNQNSNTNEEAVMEKEGDAMDKKEEDVMGKDDTAMGETDDAMIKDDPNQNSNTNEEAVMKNKDEVMEKDDTNTSVTTEPITEVDGKYIDYSEATYASTASQTRILYFHASWCPTCKVADADILSNLDKIPDNVVILKLDYDTETVLKKKYGVTYQHTFVIVDASGNEIKKWNGGGIDLIVKNVN